MEESETTMPEEITITQPNEVHDVAVKIQDHVTDLYDLTSQILSQTDPSVLDPQIIKAVKDIQYRMFKLSEDGKTMPDESSDLTLLTLKAM